MPQRILLVEGGDDQNLTYQVANHFLIGAIEVKNCDGIANLLALSEATLRGASDLEAFGVLVDADADPQARWQALRGRIAALPQAPNASGTLVTEGGRRIGAWMMPDNASPGTLEDFLISLVRPEDKDMPRVETFLAGIPTDERKFSPSDIQKARVHAWLAVQDQPGRPYGLAFRAGLFDRDGAQEFGSWLRALLAG